MLTICMDMPCHSYYQHMVSDEINDILRKHIPGDSEDGYIFEVGFYSDYHYNLLFSHFRSTCHVIGFPF